MVKNVFLFTFLFIFYTKIIIPKLVKYEDLEQYKNQLNCKLFKDETMSLLGNSEISVEKLIDVESCILCEENYFLRDEKCFLCSDYYPNCLRCNSSSCFNCRNGNHILLSFESLVLENLNIANLNLENTKNELLNRYYETRNSNLLIGIKDQKLCYSCYDKIQNLDQCENCLDSSTSSTICNYCPIFFYYDYEENKCVTCDKIIPGCNRCIINPESLKYSKCFECSLPYVLFEDVCVCKGGYLSLSNSCLSITIIILFIVSTMIIFIIFVYIISKFIRHFFIEEEPNVIQSIRIEENHPKTEKSLIKYNIPHDLNCIFCNKVINEKLILNTNVNLINSKIKSMNNDIDNNENAKNGSFIISNNLKINRTFDNKLNNSDFILTNENLKDKTFNNIEINREKYYNKVMTQFLDSNKFNDNINFENTDIYYFKSFCGGFICNKCFPQALDNMESGYFDKCKICHSLIIGLFEEEKNENSIDYSYSKLNNNLKEIENIENKNLEKNNIEDPNIPNVNVNDVKIEIVNDKINEVVYNIDRCPVCLGHGIDCTIPCDFKPWHRIHKHCLMNMVNNNVKNCPICRSSLMM